MPTLEHSTIEDHPEVGMMAGASTGKDGVHDAEKIPLGMARYMLVADHVRRIHGAEGVFFFGNQREKTPVATIQRRVGRTKDLAKKLIPEMPVWTEADLPEDVRERVSGEIEAAGLPELMAFEQHGQYKLWQTHVVGTTLLRNGYRRRIKYGWQATEEGELMGEHQFDSVLPEQWQIDCLYGPADRDTDGHWAVPYLLSTRNPKGRICIPLRKNGIDAELQKLQPGVRRVTLDTWRETALVILGQKGPDALHAGPLAADPLDPALLESVTDTASIDEVRALLHAALTKLCE